MSVWEIILLGAALAMDCLAVSVAKGVSAGKLYPASALMMALSFGLFQAGMPLVGYFAGSCFASFISRFAPWIALVLLGFIGGKMIKEHFEDDAEGENKSGSDYGFLTIIVLSVATSIDALATGLIFVGNPSSMYLAVLIIGIFSFVFSFGGTLAGVFLGTRFRFPAELVGGVILVCIGLKIFISSFIA